MSTTSYDIGYNDNPPLEQGSTFELVFTITNIFEATVTTDLTLTGQYRPTILGSTFFNFTGEILSVTPTTVTCKLSMDATTTATLVAGKGSWDCELSVTNALLTTYGFVIKPLGCGNRAKVKGEVTRA